MASKSKTPSPSSPITIGNCEVAVESRSFTVESASSSLRISVSRKAQITIAVKGDGSRSGDDDNRGKDSEGKGDEYTFVLVNPKEADSRSKSLIKEILKLYTAELPNMNYAANTGKESLFLERCVSNGKYCTLLLETKSLEGLNELAAAITYQIVPADTHYAEIPLAAVGSIYQHRGIGRLLFMELRSRLHSVGISTIFCWGDKESEGFWVKMGFVSVAEVDNKGRARRLPIRADIRKALCLPGGSTLMVAHLNKDASFDPLDSTKLCMKQCTMFSSSAMVKFRGPGHAGTNCTSLEMMSRPGNGQPEGLLANGMITEAKKVEEHSHNHSSGEDLTNEVDCQNAECYIESSDKKVDTDLDCCPCSGRGKKRMVWEATLSSLKSKKVRGSQQIDCHLHSAGPPVLAIDGNASCFKGCSLGYSGNNISRQVIPQHISSSNSEERDSEKCTPFNMTSGALQHNVDHSGEASFRIMLMDIADDVKKAHLTKVIQQLGGVLAVDGCTSTHVITGKVRRTLNFCTALCSGAWIVSPQWLKQSFQTGRFVDELPYVVEDEDYSFKYRSTLKDAVIRGKDRRRALLKGYSVCISAHIQPPIKTLTAIVNAAGGTVIRRLDKVNDPSKTIFIACEEDTDEALLAVKKGIWTFSSDWFMSCIMRQELHFEEPQFAESL